MIKPGKKTKEWDKAKVELKKEFQEMGITSCEIRLPDCTNSYMLGWAHTRKRRFVTDIKRVVLACQNCHQKVEYECEKWTSKDMETYLEEIIQKRGGDY